MVLKACGLQFDKTGNYAKYTEIKPVYEFDQRVINRMVERYDACKLVVRIKLNQSGNVFQHIQRTLREHLHANGILVKDADRESMADTTRIYDCWFTFLGWGRKNTAGRFPVVEISDIHPSDVVEKTLASRTNKFEYEEQSTQIKYKVMLIGMLSLHLLLVLYVNLPTFKGSVRGDIHAAIGDIMEEIKKEKKPEGISDEIMSAIYGDHLSSLGLESLGSHPCFPNRVTRGIFSKLALTKSIPTTRKKKSDSNREQADAEERRKKEAIDFFGLRCLQSCPGWPANGPGVQPATQPEHSSRIPDSPPMPTSPMDFTSNALPAGSSDNLPPPSWSFLAPPPQIYNSVRPQSNTSSSTSHAPPIPPASTHSNMGIDLTIPSFARAGTARSSHRPSRRHAGASGPSSRIVPSIRRRETTSPTREDESNRRRLDSDINDTLSDPIASVGGFGQLPTIMEPLTLIGDPWPRPASCLQICSWLPSSTTRLVGSLKNSIALSELLVIHPNSCSRHRAIPGRSFEGISFCRPRKKLVLMMLNGSPIDLMSARSRGMSTSSMKP